MVVGLVEVLGKRLRLSEYSLSAVAAGSPSVSSASAAVVHSSASGHFCLH